MTAGFRVGKALLCTTVVFTFLQAGNPGQTLAADPANVDFKRAFLESCDIACRNIAVTAPKDDAPPVDPKYRDIFTTYKDSYSIRGLAVAYDLTGDVKYLNACRQWANRTVRLQAGMIPAGAYYMNYGRKPGETKGEWFVADSSSNAMAVLATAVRVADPAQKKRYLDSVRKFAKLVMENYVGPNGGITDGCWPEYAGEWFLSTGVFGSAAFHLYKETGEEPYRKVALGAIDFLNRQDLYHVQQNVQSTTFDKHAPMVVMYFFEAYAAGLPYLEAGTPRYVAAMQKYREALDWMARAQEGRGGKSDWKYESWQGAKFGGLPFQMYVYARAVPGNQAVELAADQELSYISRLLAEQKPPVLSALRSFVMLSYAEKVCPGALFRKSSDPIPTKPGKP